MVICKYFLQGNCKFGQNCKYEHEINDSAQNYSASIMRQTQAPNNIDTNTLVRAVQTDMHNAEKGGQWLLSSYAPFKDKPAFPGFEDKCFEEVRLWFYEASKSGTVQQYVQQLQSFIKDAIAKTRALQNPSPEAVHMLTQIYNTHIDRGHPSSQQFSSNNLNSIPDNNSISTSKNIFNQNNQPVFAQQTVFGSVNSNIFSGSPQNSIFSSPPQNSSNSNIFAGTQQNIFGGSQSPNNVFGRQRNLLFDQSQSAVFVPQQNSPVNSLGNHRNNMPFSENNLGNNLPFSMQNTSVQNHSNSPLAGNFNVAHPSVFNQVSQSSHFNIQQQNSQNIKDPFNVPQTQGNTIFPSQTSKTFEFKLPDQQIHSSALPILQQTLHNPDQKSSTNNIFGSKATSLSVVNIDESVYSKIEDLSESDIKAFQNDKFEFGQIPEKPPTLQMCF